MLKNCIFVLDNIREEDLVELNALWGSEWKERVLKTIKKEDVLFAFGKDEFGDDVPIAMGGFVQMPCDMYRIACVWLLSTKYISINKIRFMKELKRQFFLNETKYDILYNYIYKSNREAKRWLYKLGFSFDNPKPKEMKVRENFEFFYKFRKGK